jgi:16S rRNA (guanine966-N2)-methyltransferase
MRIVAGELRGRRLAAPDARTTRPTTDRVREAVFNALASLDAVVCTFVERDRAAARVIDANIAALGVGARSRVLIGDGVALAPRIDADLVFADPPYGFDDWPRLLQGVRADLVVAEAAVVVEAPDGWAQGRVKRYGRTWVTFLHRDGHETTETPAAELP